MRKIAYSLLSLFICTAIMAQTNTFPTSGNVGIGTTSPNSILRIDDTYSLLKFDAVDGQFRLRSTRLANYAFSDLLLSAQKNIILYPDGNGSAFSGGGNVGIGTTSPWAPLSLGTISNALYEEGVSLAFEGGSFNQIGYRFKANGSNYYQVLYNGTAIEWKHYTGSSGYETRMALSNSGNLGIGTTSPQAALDVATFINNEEIGTVFGRLSEGNAVGNGTFLGVKGYETQISTYNGKSFAIEHNFYGETNSSINFFRGGSTTGGYITFNTNNNSEKVRITSDGKVGIGSTSPSHTLTVQGGPSGAKGINIMDGNSRIYFDGRRAMEGHNGTSRLDIAEGFGTTQIFGNVGMGVINPSEKLEVNGNALIDGELYSKKVKVSMNPGNWPDYVFASSYELRALSDVENFVKKNGR